MAQLSAEVLVVYLNLGPVATALERNSAPLSTILNPINVHWVWEDPATQSVSYKCAKVCKKDYIRIDSGAQLHF